MSKILITRSEEQGRQFVANFCELYGDHFLQCFVFEPLIRIERKDVCIDYDRYDAFLATSQNAIIHDMMDRQFFYVGMSNIDDVQDLLRFVKSQNQSNKYLYLRGEDIRFDLKARLESSGYFVDEIVTYSADAVCELSCSSQNALSVQSLEFVTLFSARTAKIFMELSQKKHLLQSMSNIKVLCISEAVLECVHSEFFKDVRVAQKPNARAMMDLIKECIDEHAE